MQVSWKLNQMQLWLHRTCQTAVYLCVLSERCWDGGFWRRCSIHLSVLLLRLLFLCFLLCCYRGDNVSLGNDFGSSVSGAVFHESLVVLHNGCWRTGQTKMDETAWNQFCGHQWSVVKSRENCEQWNKGSGLLLHIVMMSIVALSQYSKCARHFSCAGFQVESAFFFFFQGKKKKTFDKKIVFIYCHKKVAAASFREKSFPNNFRKDTLNNHIEN